MSTERADKMHSLPFLDFCLKMFPPQYNEQLVVSAIGRYMDVSGVKPRQQLLLEEQEQR